MTVQETKDVVSAMLSGYDGIDLSSEDFTRVASHILTEAGIGHVAMLGRLGAFGREIESHYWIVLKNGVIVDYRARNLLGDNPEVPHGVFEEPDFPSAKYFGDEVDIVTNKIIFRVLVRGGK